ncbi:terminase [Aeromonas enteropelogenes]|uniref:hypothetical protein n=1 Tax=Aeromonas enteropelogenes TaxID=29489 RepID=UPI0005A8C090|nr:hypothetical protein [Aeromonas enteropelogenes]UBH57079.1 terminase [Aeromonas enteropelogenes]
MGKHIDWQVLQAAFIQEHAETGIAAKAWCAQRGLNYQSARRYIKPRTAQSGAQSDVRCAQKSAQLSERKMRNSGQSAQSAQTTKSSTDSGQNAGNILASGRDKHGRFIKGHRESVGNAGNPHPPSNIKPGMQMTKTHGGYAKFLDADELFDQAKELRLRDELLFTRARALSVTKSLKTLQYELAAAQELSDRIALYDKILKAEQALDRNIQRIESIERTLSALRIDEVSAPKIEADTKRIDAATRKLEAEAERLEQDGGRHATPVGDMLEDLQEAGTGGLMP